MSVQTPIYLDHHATTPVDKRVLDAMLPYFKEQFGNAASRTHSFGWEAEDGVDQAREQIATLINAQPKDIIFTSGATESDNLAIKGVAAAAQKTCHIITQATEHHAILDPCRALENHGVEITTLPVDAHGLINPDDVKNAVQDNTILVSIMMANNEMGTIYPLHEIGQLCQEKNIYFHTDAAQAIGKLPIDVEAMHIDLLSISAHKLYGPKGVGALYVRSRPRVRLIGQMDGGGHEKSMRSGTLNVPGIVGLGKACEIAQKEMAEETDRIKALRNQLQQKLSESLDQIQINGHPEHRLTGNLNISFAAVDGESLLMGLSEIALSSGSACTSASLEPSYVLRAMGISAPMAQSSIRFGIGRFNTEAEIDYTAERVIEEVNRLRKISPNYKTR
ncbi:MAG: IscS subfamily cysteine desulfurase [Candidatus Latescibacteria bacterium]|jgi:cysteine desulfurase|nr:IscS subfamily cysteine desulfurase [Candidatus Latescibacterota bacterium]MBT4139339.1 IscS subfamily cysteine desulfurase [Candidatus Latescibacterota bacterium]MBT5830548.1 IscS subfamily cysteine desulfurase [Candidatus Latescibacterota bacterium]